jgi:hypothetical protein
MLLLGLVMVLALSPVNVVSSQDVSRLCLSRAVLHGRVAIGNCAGDSIDRARYGGRTYSDKAPGLSLLALPAVAALRLSTASRWQPNDNASLWVIRLTTSGVALMILSLCVGRVSEGLVPGSGGLAILAVGAGTMLASLGATTFDHVPTAALLFGAFVLAWARRWVLAGVVLGAALLVEYEGFVAVPAFSAYVGTRAGWTGLVRFAAGMTPPLVVLGAYDRLAFGSPLHPAYRYVANRYAAEQQRGLYGISLPHLSAVHQVLFGDRGLIVTSPFLVLALAGLILGRRRARVEFAFAATLALLFFAVECGYFLPFGGISPGPRFVAPAIPFVCLGLGAALDRSRRLTVALVGLSVIATTVLTLTWALSGDDVEPYRTTVWGEFVRSIVAGPHSRLGRALAPNALEWLGLGSSGAIAVMVAAAAAALAAAAPAARGSRRTLAEQPPS